MKKYDIAVFVIIALIFIRIFAGGFIGEIYPAHFDNGEISFDYPLDWDVTKDTFNINDTYGNLRKVTAGKKSDFFHDEKFVLYSGVYNESYSFEDLENMQKNRAVNAGDKIISDKTILINGVRAAYIHTANKQGNELLEITFTKDQKIYYYLVFSADKIENMQTDVDKIVNSLCINYDKRDKRDYYVKQAILLNKEAKSCYNQFIQLVKNSKYDEAISKIDEMTTKFDGIIKLEENAYQYSDSPYREYISTLIKRDKAYLDWVYSWKQELSCKKEGNLSALHEVNVREESKKADYYQYNEEISDLLLKNKDMDCYIRQNWN